MTDNEPDGDFRGRFSISLRLHHPSMTPQEMTQYLGWEPDYARQIGERVGSGTTGRIFTEHYWLRTTWHTTVGFVGELMSLLHALEKRTEFIQTFTRTNGLVRIVLYFDGRWHLGDTLRPELLNRIAGLNAELDIEVFPRMAEFDETDV